MALWCSWDTLYLVSRCKKLEWRYGIPETPGNLLLEKRWRGWRCVVPETPCICCYSLQECKENGVVLFLRHLVSCYSLKEVKRMALWCSWDTLYYVTHCKKLDRTACCVPETPCTFLLVVGSYDTTVSKFSKLFWPDFVRIRKCSRIYTLDTPTHTNNNTVMVSEPLSFHF
jgi:hypothetical protein